MGQRPSQIGGPFDNHAALLTGVIGAFGFVLLPSMGHTSMIMSNYACLLSGAPCSPQSPALD
jgi:hypothetical protein